MLADEKVRAKDHEIYETCRISRKVITENPAVKLAAGKEFTRITSTALLCLRKSWTSKLSYQAHDQRNHRKSTEHKYLWRSILWERDNNYERRRRHRLLALSLTYWYIQTEHTEQDTLTAQSACQVVMRRCSVCVSCDALLQLRHSLVCSVRVFCVKRGAVFRYVLDERCRIPVWFLQVVPFDWFAESRHAVRREYRDTAQ